MVKVAVFLIIGVLMGRWFLHTPMDNYWLWGAVSCFSILVFLGKHPFLQSLFLLLTVSFLGGYRYVSVEKGISVSFPQDAVTYDAVVFSEPVEHGKVVMCDLLVINSTPMLQVKASILRDTVDNRYKRLHVGDGIQACSVLEKPHNFKEATFDYARWLTTHGYNAQTFVFYNQWRKAPLSLTGLPMSKRAILACAKFRQRLLQKIPESGIDGKSQAVFAAVALGEKSLLDKELKEDYSVAGASHVLALSGMHLSMIYMLLSLLFVGIKRHWIGQLVLLLLVWTYVVLVGMSPSVVRSAIMLTLYAIIGLIHRGGTPLNTLALAAVLMLAVNPFALYDVGFQLSFMAVLGILVFFPLLKELIPFHYRPTNKILQWIMGMVMVSLSAQTMTAPLVALYFGRFSCYFLLANLLAVPCMTILLPCSACFFLFSSFSFLRHILATSLSFLLQLMNNSMTWVSSLPGASLENLSPVWWQVIRG